MAFHWKKVYIAGNMFDQHMRSVIAQMNMTFMIYNRRREANDIPAHNLKKDYRATANG